MNRERLRILQVAPADCAGGAERSAHSLFRAYRELGHDSWLAVGRRHGNDPQVIAIPGVSARNAWVQCFDAAVSRADAGRLRGLGRAARWLRAAGEPGRMVSAMLGREDFEHPGSRGLLDLVPVPVDLVHLHNLHGDYFDLRLLPILSARIPTVLNLRDAWLLSGHCAFPLGCERWKQGCGHCPDLDLYPAIRRDATAFNWERKRRLFAASRVFVTTPSKWLMQQVRESVLAPAIAAAQVIGNGVDTAVFNPGDRLAARRAIGLDPDLRVVMTAANGIRSNPWKDYVTLRNALARVDVCPGRAPLTVLAVGESAPDERLGDVVIRFIPYVHDREVLANLYRSADVYVHAARVESFGNTLLEAAACGTPVVSTAVGGIPEHVMPLDCPPAATGLRLSGPDQATGVLTAPSDPESIAAAVSLLLHDGALREVLGTNAARGARDHWSLDRQAGTFLSWYQDVLDIATHVT